MWRSFWRLRGGWFGCLALCLAGSVLLARQSLDTLSAAFETDARIMHRVLSQRMAQHDAILATVSLLRADVGAARLAEVYPQVLSIARHAAATPWADARLQQAAARSLAEHRPELAYADFAAGRYVLVQAAPDASLVMAVDLARTLPWSEWPGDPRTSPTRVVLRQEAQRWQVQPGEAPTVGWRFATTKRLASASQPFDLEASRVVGWRELPWLAMAGWCAGVLVLAFALRQWLAQRAARERAEALLRVGQVGRLNALGELAAGLAHELNQPLTAVLANTQAARRLLDEAEPDLAPVRGAMLKATEQARRAAEVVARLRRVMERPESATPASGLDLVAATSKVLYLLEPECRQRHVVVSLTGEAACRVIAEPVGLEQVIHNLVMNALQALEATPSSARRLDVRIGSENARGVLEIADSGPGIAPDALPHLFEPFFSTREGGLGLGLSLSESLLAGMGGTLAAQTREAGGALFRVSLQRAGAGQ